MTNPTPQTPEPPAAGKLSPAAQAVLDAAYGLPLKNGQPSLAAALRAAADQVVPEQDSPDAEEWLGQSAWIQAEQGVRFCLRAIAAELEAARQGDQP